MNPSSVRSARPIFVLDLDVLGQHWRIASRATVVTSGTGEADRIFRGGLPEAAVEQALGSLGQATPQEPTITLSGLHLEGALERLADGGGLIVGRGELAAIVDGDVWEQRTTLAAGRVRDVRVARNDLVSFVLGETLGDDAGTLIPSYAVVDAESWPNAPEGSDGAVYPIVIGAPGPYTGSDGTAKNTAATPAIMVDDTANAEVLLLSLGKVEASTVRIRNADDATTEDLPVTQTTDGRGVLVSVVSLATAVSLTVDAEATYHARWSGGGGIIGTNGATLAKAGEVLVWALSRSSLPFDLQGFEAVRSELDRYILAGYIDDTGFSPTEWVADNLLPILPVSLGFGARGIYPIVRRWGQMLEDAELHIDVDEVPGEIEIDDDALEVDGEPIPTFALRYAWSIFHQEPKRSRTLSGDPAYLAVTSDAIMGHASLSAAADMARTSRGSSVVETVETRMVYDEATAGRVLSMLAALRALPVLSISLRVSWWWLARLRLGQVVSLTASELTISRTVCEVTSITYGDRDGRVKMRLIADPERNRHNRS